MASAHSWFSTFWRSGFPRLSALAILVVLSRVDGQNRSNEVQILMNFKLNTEVTAEFNVNGLAVPFDPTGYWSSWKETDENPCAWGGVTCTVNFTVEQLDLSGWGVNFAKGIFQLSELPDLRELDLSSNDLGNFRVTASEWMIPEGVQNLTGLTRLDLSRNNLNGGLLALSTNQLPKLRYLFLEQNKLEGEIPSLTGLASLEFLSLADNQLTGSIPNDLGEIGSLISIDLSGNMLNGTIPSLSNLTKLLEFKLDNNTFTSFEEPSQLPVPTSLKYLYVSGNQLEGPFPNGLTNMVNLEVLNMSNNRLTGKIPIGLGRQLNQSFWLDLSQNLLTGKIPSDLLRSSPYGQVTSLNLSLNNLSGSIDLPLDGGEEPFYYVVLDLSRNQLSGPIPFISKNASTQIFYLWLQDNQLSGDIIDLFAYGDGFRNSRELRFGRNLLTGDLSRVASNWTAYRFKGLDLNDNKLHRSTTEATPDPLRSMLEGLSYGVLRRLHLAGNNFSGTSLPSAINPFSPIQSLEILDLSRNQLQGKISTSFNSTVLPSLQILNFSDNEVTGQIPGSILTLPLRVLNVSNNGLSGPLPVIPPDSVLYNPSFFAGNTLCGNPLSTCVNPRSTGIQWWWLLIIVGGSLVIAFGSCLAATWRWRVYRKRHQQDADLIKTLTDRESAILMSLRELKRATDNFAESAQIGSGGFGTVYTGKLTDGTRVAIKRSKREGSDKDKEQFLNEVRILSQVNHRNLVKLLGCCMENKVAVLVFEFVSNGTLQEHLQGEIGGDLMGQAARLSWKQRLNIAVQAAEALNYLHTAASFPIYHRDVKSANILLTDDLNAKVGDFGTSKLAPLEATHVSTAAIQGTMGYIDPEYYTSYQLTSKSDVYSFGVVLLELISAKPPIDFRRGGDETSLVNFAIPLIKSGDLQQLIDPTLGETYSDSGGRESMLSVGRLAMQCVDMRSRARPSMNEVLIELQTIWVRLDGPFHDHSGSMDENYKNYSRRDNIIHLSDTSSIDTSFRLSMSDSTYASAVQMSQFSPNDMT